MKRHSFLIGSLISIIFVGVCFAQSTETITLTTYYPAPHGVYRELRLYPHSTSSVCDAAHLETEGTLVYTDTGQLRYCDGTAWRTITNFLTFDDANDYLYTNDAETAEIWKVGIGTKIPGALLDIKEQGALGAANILKISSADPNSDLTLYTSGNAGDVKYNFKTRNGANEYDTLTIDNLGNIGVADTDPEIKVAGTGGYIDAKDVWLRDIGAWASAASSGGGPGDWDCTYVRGTERWYYNTLEVYCPAEYKIIDSHVSGYQYGNITRVPDYSAHAWEYISQGSGSTLQFGIRYEHPGHGGYSASSYVCQVNLFCCK